MLAFVVNFSVCRENEYEYCHDILHVLQFCVEIRKFLMLKSTNLT